ncbi:helix-turn-helix domain-containing protein [Spirosoma areae]
MTTDQPFPAISPEMARERFLIKDESWATRFKPNFNQFIISTIEDGAPVIKLPVPPGRTGNHALFLVTGGHIQMTVGYQAYTLPAQALVIVPALQIFSINSIRDDTTGFMCFFSPELISTTSADHDFAFLKLTGNPFMPLTPTETGYMMPVLIRLATEYSANGAQKTDLIRPYLLALLGEINRVYASTTPARADAGERLLQGFMDLLNKQIRQHHLVADYAERLHVSPNHLNKVVKSRTGQSPSVWIDERLVLEAKVWLFQSDLAIARIAAELGFDDQSTFGKLFRKYAGISPTHFRSHYTDRSGRVADAGRDE